MMLVFYIAMMSEDTIPAKFLALEIENPERLILNKVDSSTRPAMRGFIHTTCRKFTQGQLFYALLQQNKENSQD